MLIIKNVDIKLAMKKTKEHSKEVLDCIYYIYDIYEKILNVVFIFIKLRLKVEANLCR